MIALVNRAQVVAIDMCVDLRRGEIGVAEHLLHGAQVRAAFEQMRRERVAQRVRRHPLGEPGAPRRRLDDTPGTDA